MSIPKSIQLFHDVVISVNICGVAGIFEIVFVQIDFHLRIISLQFSRISLISKIPSVGLPLKISFNIVERIVSSQANQKIVLKFSEFFRFFLFPAGEKIDLQENRSKR